MYILVICFKYMPHTATNAVCSCLLVLILEYECLVSGIIFIRNGKYNRLVSDLCISVYVCIVSHIVYAQIYSICTVSIYTCR